MFSSSPNAASKPFHNRNFDLSFCDPILREMLVCHSLSSLEIKSLQAEIKGLEVMESQMSHDLQLMKRRKEIGELSKTWSGKALKALGWAFSVYCMYRVAMVSYSSRQSV